MNEQEQAVRLMDYTMCAPSEQPLAQAVRLGAHTLDDDGLEEAEALATTAVSSLQVARDGMERHLEEIRAELAERMDLGDRDRSPAEEDTAFAKAPF